MKRKVSILLALVLAISLAACGKAPADGNASSNGDASSAAETVSEAAEQTAGSEPSEGGGNVLIAYFSWADNAVLADDVDAIASPSVLVPGNVQQLAGWVQEKTGGDLFSIRITDPYPSDWDDCLARANEERGDDARPELAEHVENMESYDAVFLGYPKMEQGYICV